MLHPRRGIGVTVPSPWTHCCPGAWSPVVLRKMVSPWMWASIAQRHRALGRWVFQAYGLEGACGFPACSY